jgi:hypothetical protein
MKKREKGEIREDYFTLPVPIISTTGLRTAVKTLDFVLPDHFKIPLSYSFIFLMV